jgi:hypothetical protein
MYEALQPSGIARRLWILSASGRFGCSCEPRLHSLSPLHRLDYHESEGNTRAEDGVWQSFLRKHVSMFLILSECSKFKSHLGTVSD